MPLKVSTNGSDITLDDLGISLTHPTIDYDLLEQFSALELKTSDDLTNAIKNGDLKVKDGEFLVHADDYDPDQALIQDLGFWRDRNIISYDELKSAGNIEIVSGHFPLSLNSTASATRNVYSSGGRFVTWWADKDDIVKITGCEASGLYTIESVVDQQNLIVKESIVNSTGGSISICHPGGSILIGVDDSSLGVLQGSNIQEIIEDIDIRFTTSGFADQFVKATSTDTVASFLEDKLTAGSGIALSVVNNGQNEQIQISVSETFDPNKLVLDCDGSLVYLGKGDIVICEDPYPGPITDMDC